LIEFFTNNPFEVTVRTTQGFTRNFRTTKGVRQCVMSPLLFNLYTAELERLKKRGIGGIRVGRFRFWSLAYANDVVLIPKNKDN